MNWGFLTGTVIFAVSIPKSQTVDIEIFEFEVGAEQARGLTVVIDVLRAFSVACYIYSGGVRSLRVTEHVETALLLREKDPSLLLIGERNERRVPGFDFGNSPSEIIRANIRDRNAVLTTTAGTLGLTHARSSEKLITGSFVNAGAIVRYIQQHEPSHVSLVAMGYRARESADEDILCAEYIKRRLQQRPVDFQKMVYATRNGTGKRFFDPLNIGHSPPEDFDLCMALNRFPFVLRATPDRDGLQLIKIPVNCKP
jgi:2-phosphosulfolactate phosphatase